MADQNKKQSARKQTAPTSQPDPETPQDLSRYVTTKQAAEMLGVDRTQAARLVKAGKLKGVKLGHDWLVSRDSISKYLQTKSPKGRPPSKKPQASSRE